MRSVLIAAGLVVTLCGCASDEKAESVAPDANVLKESANKPAQTKAPASGGMPAPTASGLDPNG